MDTLYHYCSVESFVSIVNSHSIWLSASKLGNDALEGRLVSRVVDRLAKEDGLEPQKRKRIVDMVGQIEERFDALCFCLSEKRDLLSQWRGYADNASGVAIGFSYAYLKNLCVDACKGLNDPSLGLSLGQVVYKYQSQSERLRPTYKAIVELTDTTYKVLAQSTGARAGAASDAGAAQKVDVTEEELAHRFVDQFMQIFVNLYFLKSDAFEEEVEWRLVSPETRDSVGQRYKGQHDRVVPYRVFPLHLPDQFPIREVVLGPKHQTPEYIVKSFLKNNGFGDVQVSRSAASYR